MAGTPQGVAVEAARYRYSNGWMSLIPIIYEHIWLDDARAVAKQAAPGLIAVERVRSGIFGEERMIDRWPVRHKRVKTDD